MDMCRAQRRTLAKNFASSPLEALIVAATVRELLLMGGHVVMAHRSPAPWPMLALQRRESGRGAALSDALHCHYHEALEDMNADGRIQRK